MNYINPSQVEIVGDGILLRPVRLDDVPEMLVAVRESMVELKRWMTWAHDDIDESELEGFVKKAQAGWEAGREWHFIIRDRQDGALLGVCGLSYLNDYFHFANLGYWVRTSRTRRGIASRSARLLAKFAFDSLGLVRMEIVVLVDNVASLRAALNAGAKREGVLRNRMRVRDNFFDAVMHSLVVGDI